MFETADQKERGDMPWGILSACLALVLLLLIGYLLIV